MLSKFCLCQFIDFQLSVAAGNIPTFRKLFPVATVPAERNSLHSLFCTERRMVSVSVVSLESNKSSIVTSNTFAKLLLRHSSLLPLKSPAYYSMFYLFCLRKILCIVVWKEKGCCFVACIWLYAFYYVTSCNDIIEYYNFSPCLVYYTY